MSEEVQSQSALLEVERQSVIEKLNQIQEGATEDKLRQAISRRQELATQVKAIKKIKRQIDHQRNHLSDLLEQRWSPLILDLQNTKDQLSNVREAKADQINESLKDLKADIDVELSILRGADRTLLGRGLGSPRWPKEEALLKGCGLQYLHRNLAGTIATHHTPTSFVKTVYFDRPTDLTIQENKKYLISEEEAITIINHVLRIDPTSSLPHPVGYTPCLN